jgi:hypothetical protein
VCILFRSPAKYDQVTDDKCHLRQHREQREVMGVTKRRHGHAIREPPAPRVRCEGPPEYQGGHSRKQHAQTIRPHHSTDNDLQRMEGSQRDAQESRREAAGSQVKPGTQAERDARQHQR